MMLWWICWLGGVFSFGIRGLCCACCVLCLIWFGCALGFACCFAVLRDLWLACGWVALD